MHRLIITGTLASGKTTLARQLANTLSITHMEADSLRWGENWTPISANDARKRVQQMIAESGDWVFDGNYSRIRDLIWNAADTLLWLDYPLHIILWRLAKRSFQRVILQASLWNGNKEKLSYYLFNKQSPLYLVIKSYRKKQREYPELFKAYPNLTIIHLRSPQQTQHWLEAYLENRQE